MTNISSWCNHKITDLVIMKAEAFPHIWTVINQIKFFTPTASHESVIIERYSESGLTKLNYYYSCSCCCRCYINLNNVWCKCYRNMMHFYFYSSRYLDFHQWQECTLGYTNPGSVYSCQTSGTYYDYCYRTCTTLYGLVY